MIWIKWWYVDVVSILKGKKKLGLDLSGILIVLARVWDSARAGSIELDGMVIGDWTSDAIMQTLEKGQEQVERKEYEKRSRRDTLSHLKIRS